MTVAGADLGTVYDREALAWAAGLFDGEGYIACIARREPRSRNAPLLNMTVNQWHDAFVLVRFQAALGGVGHIGSRPRLGGVTEYTWRLSSFEKVQASIALLWRWLSPVKRQQAMRALTGFQGHRQLIGVRAYRRQQRAGQ